MHQSVLFLILLALAFKVFRKVVLIGVAFYVFCKMEISQRYRVYVIPFADGQLASEIKAAVSILPLDLFLIGGAHYLGWFKPGPYSLLNVVSTFIVMFAWYEIWFYFTHRLFHMKMFYFIHAQHHTARVTSPWSGFSFSYLERLMLNIGAIGFGAAVSHLIPFSILGFGLYFIANNVMNVLLHCNVEIFPVWFARSTVGRWVFTPTFHAMHHARFQRHYGLFTQIPDRLLHTVWPDYEEVQARAAEGHGLNNVNERLYHGKDPHKAYNMVKAPDVAAAFEQAPQSSS